MPDLIAMSARIAPVGLDLPEIPAWVGLALCAETDPEAFFPEPGAVSADLIALAKRVCARCDVREDCLDYAVEHRVEHGIWGGQTVRERERERRGKAPAAPRLKRECVHGHELTAANVRLRPDGSRLCLACEAKRGRERRARLAAAKAATD